MMWGLNSLVLTRMPDLCHSNGRAFQQLAPTCPPAVFSPCFAVPLPWKSSAVRNSPQLTLNDAAERHEAPAAALRLGSCFPDPSEPTNRETWGGKPRPRGSRGFLPCEATLPFPKLHLIASATSAMLYPPCKPPMAPVTYGFPLFFEEPSVP